MASMTCPNDGCTKRLIATIEWNKKKTILRMRFICRECGVITTVTYESIFGEPLGVSHE